MAQGLASASMTHVQMNNRALWRDRSVWVFAVVVILQIWFINPGSPVDSRIASTGTLLPVAVSLCCAFAVHLRTRHTKLALLILVSSHCIGSA